MFYFRFVSKILTTTRLLILIIFKAFVRKSKFVICLLSFTIKQELKSCLPLWSEFSPIIFTFRLAIQNSALLLSQDSLNYVFNDAKQKVQASEIG